MSYKDNPSNYTRCEKCKHIDRENEKCKITNDNWLVSDRAGTCHQFEGVENMKVRCVEACGWEDVLELGKCYKVLEEDNVFYEIDLGFKPSCRFRKERFEIVEDEKLEENPLEKLTKKIEENVKKGAEMLAKCSMSSMDIEKSNNVDHPSHYNKGKFEVIDVIEDWNLNFCLGNVVKYIGRAGYKDDIIQELKKARWYLDREIEKLEKGK